MDSVKPGRKNARSKLIRRLFAFGLLAIVVLLANATWKMYQTYRGSIARKALIEEEYRELKERLDTVESQVGRLQTEEGREAEIRKSFNVVKPGEEVAIVVDDRLKEEIKKEKQPWYTWLWRGSLVRGKN